MAPKWSQIWKSEHIEISNCNFTAEHITPEECDSSVKTDKGFCSDVHYFEVIVVQRGRTRHPYIGIIDESFELKRKKNDGSMWGAPFTNNYTYGSTGSIWFQGNRLFGDLDTYGDGDCIGCLVDFKRKVIAFYLNQKLQIAIEAPFISGHTIYPAVGLFGSDHKVTLRAIAKFPEQNEIQDEDLAKLPNSYWSFRS